ncbi:MAG TPA: sialidase family protein [Chthoniobacteraceae bacterium]|nr:sialidase family protein [Chthoniobacteraceae bacterium]
MKKLHDLVVYQNRGEYAAFNSFPNAAITHSGRMVLAFRQARDYRALHGKTVHIDPKARGVLIASEDHGATWSSPPSTMADHFLYGVQDPCLKTLRDGTLLGTYFLWKAVEAEPGDGIPPAKPIYPGWGGLLVGAWTVRSADEGRTWDEPVALGTAPLAVRGNPVELPDGTLLLAAYGQGSVHLLASTDYGRNWTARSVLQHPDYSLQEPNLHLTPSGKVIVFIRSVPRGEDALSETDNARWRPETPLWQRGRLFTAESTDQGRHWSPLCPRPVYSSSPSHLLPLASGRVLLSYGYRKPPYGIRARLLDAECAQWGEEIVLRDDGGGFDLGYTSAVQAADGTIWIFYYWYETGGDEHRHIVATLCREDG